MTCAACQANVDRCVRKLDGVSDVDVSLLGNRMTVTYDENRTAPDAIIGAVESIGYGASLPGSTDGAQKGGFRSEWEERQKLTADGQGAMRRRLVSSVILLIPLMYIAMGPMMGIPTPGIFVGMENALISALTQLIITIPIIVINLHFYTNGFRALAKRSPNMDSLVAVGSAASLVYGCLPCTAWRTASATAIWRSCTNIPTRCILSRRP